MRDRPWVVVRSKDDMPLVVQTLDMLPRQCHECRVLVMDNCSTDGTREEAAKRVDRVIDVPRGEYVPGRVLNRAMAETDGDFVVFLNSDCTPQDDRWLERLLSGFDAPDVAAVFGRQIPRPDCRPLFAKDTEATFGDGSRQGGWRHCFSMASSAVRRTVWEERPFDESIQYSEDIEWTWWARRSGRAIRYAADSVVAHSHNYTLGQFRRRQFGEGKAEALFFEWSDWDRSFWRYSLLPFARQVLSDWKHCVARGEFRTCLESPLLRWAQLRGRRAGFLEGLEERETKRRSVATADGGEVERSERCHSV